jgi:hypoxanthine phosphoribosyltransferase
VLISAEELAAAATRVAAELSAAHTDGLVLVAVLKGSIPFLADLVRRLTIVPEVDFMAISAYAPDTGRVRIVKDLDMDISGRDVVLVEDIVDTGLTLQYLLENLETRAPAGVRVCALLDKPARRKVAVRADYVGFSIEDLFVIGYGLDYAQRYRELPYIGTLKPEVYSSPHS